MRGMSAKEVSEPAQEVSLVREFRGKKRKLTPAATGPATVAATRPANNTGKTRRVGLLEGEDPSELEMRLPKGWMPTLGVTTGGAVPYKPGMRFELKNDNDTGFEGAWFIGMFHQRTLLKERRSVNSTRAPAPFAPPAHTGRRSRLRLM